MADAKKRGEMGEGRGGRAAAPGRRVGRAQAAPGSQKRPQHWNDEHSDSATNQFCGLGWDAAAVWASVSPIREDGPRVRWDGPTKGRGAELHGWGVASKGRANQERQGAGPALKWSRQRV